MIREKWSFLVILLAVSLSACTQSNPSVSFNSNSINTIESTDRQSIGETNPLESGTSEQAKDGTSKADNACGENLQWSIVDGTLTIRGNGEMEDYDYFDKDMKKEFEAGVKQIKQPWDDKHAEIQKIVIEEGVTRIGDYAFYQCKNVENFQLPSTITSVGMNALAETAYYNNKKNWTDDVLYLDNWVIRAKESKQDTDNEKYKIPNGIIGIADGAFDGCQMLGSIEIPDTVITIGRYAFSLCSGFRSITIPSSVKHIEPNFVSDCYNLEEIKVENGNPNYSSYKGCLYNADKTKFIATVMNKLEVTLASEVKEIGEEAFACSSVKEIDIPEGLTSIGRNAFYGCENLQEIVLPKSLQVVGEGAFAGSNLKNIYFKSNAPKIQTEEVNQQGIISLGNLELFEEVSAAIYYPKNDDTWKEFIQKNYGGTIQWKEWTP